MASGSPCPPPSNGICLTIPLAARAVDDDADRATAANVSPNVSPCAGNSLAVAACRTGRFAHAVTSIGSSLFSSSRGSREGRVFRAVPSFSNPKSALRKVADEHEPGSVAGVVNAVAHVPSSDLELDHSMAMLCRLRDGPGACGAVYATQAAYNASHARMAAALAADAALAARDAAQEACDGFNDRVREMETAARSGTRVCREREIEAVSDPLVEQLRETRRALLNGGANGGKCDRADAAAVAAALAGEAVSRENALPRAGKVVGIERETFKRETGRETGREDARTRKRARRREKECYATIVDRRRDDG